MCDDNIEIGVTEITNNILVSAQPTDQIIDINVLEEVENVELTITPSVVEVNIDVTQELITEVVTVDANTCVNIIDVTVTDATDNVTLNITPSLVEVNINRGENNLSIEEYETFFDLPTIGDTDTYYITLDENKFWRWDNINEVYVEISPSSAVWGSITGTLNDQIDLRNALNAKQNQLNGNGFVKASGTTISYDNTTYFPFPSGDTTQYIAGDGSLISFPIDGQSGALVRQVRNATGATLTKGTVVYVNGAIGNKPSVAKALATSDATSAQTFGLVQADIPNNSNGYVICYGDLTGLDTQSLTEGAQLYLSSTTAGAYTTTKQYAPNHLVYVGVVTRSHPNQGQIEVRIQNGYEMDELHNVSAQSPSNKDGLFFNSSTNLWEKNQLSNIISATTPLAFASNVLSITKADATTDGYLSSTDWNYFSAKQQPLSGTGFVKATGSVISYDNTVYTPQSRTLTINGTAYDLSADRSWTISVGSGMRNVSTFIATSGQTTFTIVGGYTAGLVDVFVNGARLNSGDYTATNGTTVVLGTGVVANDIVDIINYTASLTSGITGSGTANYVPKWSSSSNLTNSLIYDDGTNIGINTITASALFHVYYNSGSSTTYTDIALFGRTGSRGLYVGANGYGFSLNADDNGADWGIQTDWDSGFMRFHYGASEKMRITSNGNVGIGLTNPAYKLDVSGDINITGTYRVNGVAINSGTVTGTGTTNYIAKWSGSSAIGNSQLFDNGTNVGIGTASPSYKLDVNGIGNFASNVQAKGFVGYRTDNGVGLEVNGGDLGNGTFIAKFNDYNNATRVVITGSGNVGIATTSPTPGYMLDVVGSILSRVASGNTSMVVQTNNANGAINAIAGTGLELATDGTNQNIVFRTGSTEKMRITSAGRIGIGTTSPSGFLHVKSGNNNQMYLDNDGSQYTSLYLSNNGTVKGFVVYDKTNLVYQFGSASNQDAVAFYTGSVERMRITQFGAVRLGKLVYSDVLYRSLYIGGRPFDNGYSIVNMNPSTTDSNLGFDFGVYENNTSGNQYFFIGDNRNGERFRITSSGSVGIGYTAPGTRLQVNGAISSYNGEALLQNNTWTTVATFSNDDIMSGTFTYYVAGTNNSLICSFIKNWNGGSSQLYIGNTLASNGSVAIRVSGNSIQILQAFGVALYGYWTMQRIM